MDSKDKQKLRIAISTNIFGTFPLREALEKTGPIGIKNIEIYATHLADVGRQGNALKDLLRQTGLKAVSVHSPTMAHDFPGKTDPSFAARYEKYYAPLFASAREIGAGICVDHIDKAGFRRKEEYKSLRDEIIHNCRLLAGLAAEYDLVLAMENSSGSEILYIPEQFREILEGVAHPNFRMNLDVGHAWCHKIEPQEFVNQAGRYIANLHTGDLEITALLDKMYQSGYRGNLVLEHEENNLREAFRRTIKRLSDSDLFELDMSKINFDAVPINNQRWKG